MRGIENLYSKIEIKNESSDVAEDTENRGHR